MNESWGSILRKSAVKSTEKYDGGNQQGKVWVIIIWEIIEFVCMLPRMIWCRERH